MHAGFFPTLLAAALLAAPSAETPKTGAAGATVNAADYSDPASPTAGLQKAIDALPPEGGVVTIPPGQHVLRQAIRLRSNMTLQGAGPGTILHKTKHAESKLASTATQGSRSLHVVDPSRFSVGDQVAIRDKDALGWNVAQAIIAAVEKDELLLDRPLPRTFEAAKTGFVVHIFPALTADRASNIVIKNLAIQDDAVRDLSAYGPLDDPQAKWAIVLPFHVAAIHLNGVSNSRVENVSVKGWLSDGISVQGGSIKGPSAANDTITGCVVEQCGGMGLHPGGGLHDSLFSHNISRGNGGDGLYFCAAVQRVTVRENQLIGNQGNGVGGLGDSGDKYNTVTKNVISGNGLHGIKMCDGESNTAIDNTVANNSQLAPGQCSGIWLSRTSLSVVKGNRCFDDQNTKTQKHGIEELANCRSNVITGNDCHGNCQCELVLASANSGTRPTVRIAGIVLKWIRGDKEANLRRIEPMIREAASKQAQIVVTTECFLDGYAIADKQMPLEVYRSLGEPIPEGRYYRQLAAWTAELKIHLVAGLHEIEGQRHYNTAVVIGPDGTLIGKYRKQELGHELDRNTPGTESLVFSTACGKAGIMICADRTKPAIVERFCSRGADFLLCPSGGMFGPKTNDPIVQARSRENQRYIVFVHPAEFLVTGPDGSIVVRTIVGDRLLINPTQADSAEDSKQIFYFELPAP